MLEIHNLKLYKCTPSHICDIIAINGSLVYFIFFCFLDCLICKASCNTILTPSDFPQITLHVVSESTCTFYIRISLRSFQVINAASFVMQVTWLFTFHFVFMATMLFYVQCYSIPFCKSVSHLHY